MGERFADRRPRRRVVEVSAPPVGHDPQTPHEQDEVYFIHRGRGELVINGDRYSFKAGDCLFVAANVVHQFENFTSDFGTWVVFWGPKGGERSRDE